jgi:hypothetical protein
VTSIASLFVGAWCCAIPAVVMASQSLRSAQNEDNYCGAIALAVVESNIRNASQLRYVVARPPH